MLSDPKDQLFKSLMVLKFWLSSKEKIYIVPSNQPSHTLYLKLHSSKMVTTTLIFINI